MEIVQYTPEWFDRLQFAARQDPPQRSLLHRAFVDYYFTTSQYAKLLLAVERGEVVGTLGGELMPFDIGSLRVVLCYNRDFGAWRTGAGIYLMKKWMRISESKGLAFGGTPEFQRLIQALNWNYYGGVRIYRMNDPCPSWSTDASWKTALKRTWDRVRRARIRRFASRLPLEARRAVSVREEKRCTEDMLPRRSPFTFRFAPKLDHLNWRYRSGLSFVNYRIFRILQHGVTAGYVILNESPLQLMVAQCDAEDVRVLAWGVLHSLIEAGREDKGPRTMVLSCSHSVMAEIFQNFGFRRSPQTKPFAVGGLRPGLDIPADTSQWLVNFDWSGRALRPPFLERSKAPCGHFDAQTPEFSSCAESRA